MVDIWRLGGYQCLGVGIGVKDGSDDSEPVLVGDLVSYYCTTRSVGKSSVTLDVNVMAQRQFAESGTFIPVTEARVTMVAVGDDCKPIPLSRPQA